MKKMLSFLLCLGLSVDAQTIEDCHRRFNQYLNFRGSLDGRVQFTSDAIHLVNGGRKELTIYASELPVLARFFEQATLKEQEDFLRSKGLKKLTTSQLDSLSGLFAVMPYTKPPTDKPLKGFRIALDPGHFATTLQDAQVEQKFLYFARDASGKDSVKIFESQLTFNTAIILKNLLEEKGAEVYLTRNQSNHTSFDCTFTSFIKDHKRRVLDSLMKLGTLSQAKHYSLLKSTNYNFFWDFFRDYDLANRAMKINAFKPHVTVIIHYNVDEKNVPWKKHTSRNFSMAFIGGAFTSDNLNRSESRVNFVRLLLSDQLNRSELLAKETVSNFNKELNIAIATQKDADYLRTNCLTTASPGVFCRNLALCRKINSPLVYGESLYQDNEKETEMLMASDLDIYGVKANQRLVKVANSYCAALMRFLVNN